jgi:hypothetical protein
MRNEEIVKDWLRRARSNRIERTSEERMVDL